MSKSDELTKTGGKAIGPTFATIALAALVLIGCNREEAEEVPGVVPLEKVPNATPRANIPGEQPLPSIRTFPTEETPDDPHLALGHRVYRQACMVCHDRGAENSPVITDVAEWKPRIAKGRGNVIQKRHQRLQGVPRLYASEGRQPWILL